MAVHHNPNDTVTIAIGVLLSIVRMATLSVDGVVRTTHTPGVDRWFRRSSNEDGIQIDVNDGSVRADVYLVVNVSKSLHETCRQVQNEIVRTIREFAGMKVSSVNVHIEDIIFSNDSL